MRHALRVALFLVFAALSLTAPLLAHADTVLVPGPDGLTIQQGINAAYAGGSGWIVLVAPGTYSPLSGESFPIAMRSGVILRSESGPDVTIIDAAGTNRVMNCISVDSGTRVEGFTITGGVAGIGGGMYIAASETVYSYPRLDNVIFLGNRAGAGGGMYTDWYTFAELTNVTFSGNIASGDPAYGGGLFWDLYGPDMVDCLFVGNSANCGGGMYVSCYPYRTVASRGPNSCTFYGNSASYGGGIALYGGSFLRISNTIIAFSTSGGSTCGAWGVVIKLSCCDVFNNTGGDWIGPIEGQSDLRHNFSADPLFCGSANPDEPYSLDYASPCAEINNPNCGRVGAYGIGCGGSPVETTSWAAVKAMFR